MREYGERGLSVLIGKKITDVEFVEPDKDRMIIRTDTGETHAFDVYGDCCSWSYFHDIVGLEKLIANGPVVSVAALPEDGFEEHYEFIRVYGYEIVSEHWLWGEQTTVISFRNESNGYYGGELCYVGTV